MHAHVRETHDADADSHLSKDELYAWHRRARGLPPHEPDAEAAGAGEAAAGDHSRQVEEERWQEQQVWGSAVGDEWGLDGGEHEAEYATHSHRFDWHDADGDGVLDTAELGEYLLPHSTADGGMESLVQLQHEELHKLVAALRLGVSPAHADRFGREQEEQYNARGAGDQGGGESFELEHALAIGAHFVSSLDMLMD